MEKLGNGNLSLGIRKAIDMTNMTGNITTVQSALLEKYPVELVRDWMIAIEDDFVAKHGAAINSEIKAYLRQQFPSERNNSLLQENE